MFIANKLKNIAIVINITITKSGTDSAVISGMKITIHGINPEIQPIEYSFTNFLKFPTGVATVPTPK